MAIAACLWEKNAKNTSKWIVPENLHWIHLEGKFPEDVLSHEALALEQEDRTHRAASGTWYWGARHCCAHLGFCIYSTIVKEKGQTNLGNICSKVGKVTLDSGGQFVADLYVRCPVVWMDKELGSLGSVEHNLTSRHSHSSYVLPQPQILVVKS